MTFQEFWDNNVGNTRKEIEQIINGIMFDIHEQAGELWKVAQQSNTVALAERFCDELKTDDIQTKWIMSFARWAKNQKA